jgi:protein TonB
MKKGLVFICLFLMASVAWAQKGTKAVEKKSVVDAEFPGGADSLHSFITRNLVYPKIAFDKGLAENVVVEFTIDETGNVSEAEVIKLSRNNEVENVMEREALEKEALRLIKAMPKWKVGTVNGKPTKMNYIIPVTFSLEK